MGNILKVLISTVKAVGVRQGVKIAFDVWRTLKKQKKKSKECAHDWVYSMDVPGKPYRECAKCQTIEDLRKK